jgi:kynureninase
MKNNSPDFDSFQELQQAFHRPKDSSGKELHYFCGNSLGLQPLSSGAAIQEVLNDWANLAVAGHFKAERRWYDYPNLLKNGLARLCGALPEEVQAMGSLSSNLHLMMVSFFRPEGKRRKILMESGAFPSDQYVVESQLKFHGLNPLTDLIEVQPRDGEHSLRTEDILKEIDENAEELALVLFSGVHYLTGQAFDMESISRAAQKAGAKVGFDLAHAIGNIRLNLHQWGADFAVWCSYKYLNGGPGATGGIFVHERYAADESLPRFAGWFGHDESLRFKMEKGFRPMYGAQGWQLSNENILSLAAIRSSLVVFEKVSLEQLEQRREYLTERLQQILERYESLKIITPARRGAQISIIEAGGKIKPLFEHLQNSGVIGDYREPGVIRLAVAPLYTREEDLKGLEQSLRTFFGE